MNFFKILRVIVLLIIVSTCFGYAQDSIKKATVKPTVKPVVAAEKPVTSGIPINPKTGKPYGKWGYGTQAKAYQAQKADSSKTTNSVSPVVATPPIIATDKSLNGQYQYLLTKVYNYQQPFITAFWKNVRDSLNNSTRQLKAANDRISAGEQSLNELKTSANATEQELSKSDTVDFFGIAFSKNGYSIMMWSLVGVLAALAAIVIFTSGSARTEATYRTKLYNELEEEFKTFKAKANEKEKKLARELQTERNKVDELMGRV